LEYEARQKAILDYNPSVLEAEMRREQRGRKAGEHKRNIQIAKNIMEKGFHKNVIMEITNLTIKKIDAL